MIDHHDAEIRGRERYHGVREADLEEEMRGALLTVSGLVRAPGGRAMSAPSGPPAFCSARSFMPSHARS